MSRTSKEPRWQGESKPPDNPFQFVINSRKFHRVPYGEGEDDSQLQSCDRCGVASGDFHTIGCGAEPCPRCGGQAIACECDYEGD